MWFSVGNQGDLYFKMNKQWCCASIPLEPGMVGEGRSKVVGVRTCGTGFPSAETSSSGRRES